MVKSILPVFGYTGIIWTDDVWDEGWYKRINLQVQYEKHLVNSKLDYLSIGISYLVTDIYSFGKKSK